MTKENIINHPIPETYKPYSTISFCSNILKNLKYILDDNGLIPILIGEGDFPRIWLYAKKDNKPIALVKDSVSVLPQVKVNISQKEQKMNIEILNMKNKYVNLLEIILNKDIPMVSQLDLRPIGYRVFGDSNSLTIGNSNYSGNSFEGINTLVKMGN